MANSKSVSDFFISDKPAWATYDATRKIPSYIDGLKNSQRKLLWVAFDRLQKEYCKTETFSNIVALDTCYIHGAANLTGVCDSLTQDFIGACNFPYFLGNDGGWGSRLITRSSAPRYTKIKLSEISKILFNPLDLKILEKQWFEGQYIEPKYLVPIFPTIFLNSSSGLTAGFSESIYARNPKKIIKWIKKRLSDTKPKEDLTPWFKGYKGTVVWNPTVGAYETIGLITQVNTTNYEISEIPVEVSYQKYLEILDKLEEDKIILDYTDKCNPRTNEILFEIKTTREFSRKHNTEQELLKVFRLTKTLNEQFNCIDQDGRITEFKNIEQILEQYFLIRFDLYTKRKKFLLENLDLEIKKLVSKYQFCKGIIDKTLVVSNRKKPEIISDLDLNPKIIQIDGSYDYLLRIPISQITKEEMEHLKQTIQTKKTEFQEIKSKTENEMWIEDLTKLEHCIGKI